MPERPTEPCRTFAQVTQVFGTHSFAQMREAFDDAMVTGWEELEPGIRLPDQDDRHVVAAAIRGGAQAIITANVKDFPAAALQPLGLEATADFSLDPLVRSRRTPPGDQRSP